MKEEYIRDFQHRIIGIIQTMPNGDQIARDFNTRQVLGYYRARYDHTTNFSGVVLARGNALTGLIFDKHKVK